MGCPSPQTPSRLDLGAELGASALQGDWAAGLALNDLLAKCLLPRVWEIRNDPTTYNAVCIALAEALDAPLLTRDDRLAPSGVIMPGLGWPDIGIDLRPSAPRSRDNASGWANGGRQ
jgi:hypothetical protein